MGPSVSEFVRKAFLVASFPTEMNETLITLIPKQNPSKKFAHFRPISLCNVVVKIISKVIANHLKPLTTKIVGPNLCSFIPGRQATDNVVLVQEVIHSLKWKKGTVGSFIAKIDLKKTYDRVDWCFLEQILRTIGFDETLTKLIMFCISSTRLSILWNSKALPAFSPS